MREFTCVECGQGIVELPCTMGDPLLGLFHEELDNNCCIHKQGTWPPSLWQVYHERQVLEDISMAALDKADELGLERKDELKKYLAKTIQEWTQNLLQDRKEEK